MSTKPGQVQLELGCRESARGLARRLNYYGQRGVLVLDELGYLSYDARAADLLFQVSAAATNVKVSSSRRTWPFPTGRRSSPTPASAIALIDRLIHHAEIITIEGESYRRRAAEVTRKAPRPTPTP